MDSPGGKFSSYKSKHLATSWQMKVFQTRKNIAIAEDFRIAYINNVVSMNIEMKLYISFFQTIHS